MKYLITQEGHEPYITTWFIYENVYPDGMVVYDLHEYKYTTNGTDWIEIEEDHL